MSAEVALPSGPGQSAMDQYNVLASQKPPSPSRLSQSGYLPQRGPTGPLSPLELRRPGSPVFAMQTMEDIKMNAKQMTMNKSQSVGLNRASGLSMLPELTRGSAVRSRLSAEPP